MVLSTTVIITNSDGEVVETSRAAMMRCICNNIVIILKLIVAVAAWSCRNDMYVVRQGAAQRKSSKIARFKGGSIAWIGGIIPEKRHLVYPWVVY